MKADERDRLITEHMEQVKKAANRYYRLVPSDRYGMVSRDELISAGYEALVRAAGKFDPDYDNAFSTYAYCWINRAIKRELYEYIGAAALSIDDEDVPEIAAPVKNEETEVDPETIMAVLDLADLSETEKKVYCALWGVGREQIRNMRRIAGELHLTEIDVRRLRQSAESKVKKLTDVSSLQ